MAGKASDSSGLIPCPDWRMTVCCMQGTVSSKKKKKNKLKRVVATVKRAARKDKMSKQECFAAVQLLHDPQVSSFCRSNLLCPVSSPYTVVLPLHGHNMHWIFQQKFTGDFSVLHRDTSVDHGNLDYVR